MTETHKIEITFEVTFETIREIVEDLGFDFYWAQHAEFHEVDTGELYVGYWDDGELRNPTVANERFVIARNGGDIHYHEVQVSWTKLAEALAAIASGKTEVTNPYQVRAARDYIIDPETADGDYFTADLMVQIALFGKIVFG